MTITRLLRHDGIGQIRAVAFDETGRPLRLFFETPFETGLRLKGHYQGRIAKVSRGDGGCFVRLEGGFEGFLSTRRADDFVEGAKHRFQVAAQARRGKLARLVVANDEPCNSSLAEGFNLWRSELTEDVSEEAETGEDAAREIDAVFADARLPIVGLSGGGRLQISPTPALIAIDIDTHGRVDKGRAQQRARAINLLAADEAGRTMALRDLGGNVVLDCVAPLIREDGPRMKSAFVNAFRAGSARKVNCLPPSPLGMMEAILARGATPLHERLEDADGQTYPHIALLEMLRRAEIEAMARPADQLGVSLSACEYAPYQSHKDMIDTALKARFGGRISITLSTSAPTGVFEK